MISFSAVPGLGVPGRATPGSPGSASVTGTEAGTGTDAAWIALTGTDTSAGSDAGSVAAVVHGDETAAGADLGTVSVPGEAPGLRAGLLGGIASNANTYAGSAS